MAKKGAPKNRGVKKSEIKNRVIKMDMVKWRELKWLQTELKDLSEINSEKLKRSLVDNDFSMPFHVWQDKKTIWILDGHHRQKVMAELEKQDGIKIPDVLPAVFINCKGKKEAAKLVLVYTSIYADVTAEGLVEFLKSNDLDWEELKEEIDIPGINLDYYFGETEPLPDVDISGFTVAKTEYLIVSFDDVDKYNEVKQKLGMKGLVRAIPFNDLVEKWDF